MSHELSVQSSVRNTAHTHSDPHIVALHIELISDPIAVLADPMYLLVPLRNMIMIRAFYITVLHDQIFETFHSRYAQFPGWFFFFALFLVFYGGKV